MIHYFRSVCLNMTLWNRRLTKLKAIIYIYIYFSPLRVQKLKTFSPLSARRLKKLLALTFSLRNWSIRNWGYRGQNFKKLEGYITPTVRNWPLANSKNWIHRVHKTHNFRNFDNFHYSRSACLSLIGYDISYEIGKGQNSRFVPRCELRNC